MSREMPSDIFQLNYASLTWRALLNVRVQTQDSPEVDTVLYIFSGVQAYFATGKLYYSQTLGLDLSALFAVGRKCLKCNQ